MTGGEDEVALLAERIAVHARFPQAVRQYVRAMAEAQWRKTPALVNKVMSHGPRIRLILYLLWLHWAADPADPDGGATLTRLTAICARRGEIGPRAVHAMLGLLRLGRHIEIVRGEADRRLKLFRPRPVLVDMVRDMFLRSFDAFDLVFEAGWAERARHDDAFFRSLYLACGRPIVEGDATVTERVPDLHEFAAMDGAFTVLLHVIRAQLDGAPQPSTVAIHLATTIPRTQVWKCIQRSAQHGFTRLDAHGHIVDASAAAAVMARHVATELAYYAVTAGSTDGAELSPVGPAAVVRLAPPTRPHPPGTSMP